VPQPRWHGGRQLNRIAWPDLAPPVPPRDNVASQILHSPPDPSGKGAESVEIAASPWNKAAHGRIDEMPAVEDNLKLFCQVGFFEDKSTVRYAEPYISELEARSTTAPCPIGPQP
jgi:hypothetical protein